MHVGVWVYLIETLQASRLEDIWPAMMCGAPHAGQLLEGWGWLTGLGESELEEAESSVEDPPCVLA